MKWLPVLLTLAVTAGCRNHDEEPPKGNDVVVTNPDDYLDDSERDDDEDGYTADEDCDDSNPLVHPNAQEVPYDGLDNDCDEATLDDDLDQDGYGVLDEDGMYVGTDCEDLNAAINPGVDEVCDGIDNDCDGTADQDAVDALTFYYDVDGDGYGDDDTWIQACEGNDDVVLDAGDCNDLDILINPAAAEVCDGLDNDCNALIDDGVGELWYTDFDLDGFGNPNTEVQACNQPAGKVSDATDCDDAVMSIHPGADEYCDGLDNDCDGLTDEEGVDAPTWYADGDGDTHGDPGTSMEACSQPTGYVDVSDDCDDADSTTYVGATETCDGVDNNCDTLIDNNAVGAIDWYADADGDGFGDAGDMQSACSQPAGYITDSTDCDDDRGSVYPGATELCDGLDNDCNGLVDDGNTSTATWYLDDDGDGFGIATDTVDSCDPPEGYAPASGDCDDDDDATFPGADEVCDDADNDCDGSIDENATDADTWHLDADGDGVGGTLATIVACDAPGSYVESSDDCNDIASDVYPGAEETCDGRDQDCDGVIDNDATDLYAWYEDLDGDGFGTGTAVLACDAPVDHVALPGDCDDDEAESFPGNDEICDEIDNDCDGTIDVGASDGTEILYEDFDGDGFGLNGSAIAGCEATDGYVDVDGDCNDDDEDVNPDADEVCDDLDNDCDGQVDVDATDAETWYLDADADSYGGSLNSVVSCDPVGSYVPNNDDCDDLQASTNPDANEVCDGVDNDCDTLIDNDAVDPLTWYADTDGDGYGDASDSVQACDQPVGYVESDDDCDDTSDQAFPGGIEVCDDLDNNCDGVVDESSAADAQTFYSDVDGDGYGNLAAPVLACEQPSGTVIDATDCNDGQATIHPGATEVCDGIDQDCDGVADDGASDASTWYSDGDGDGYGDSSVSTDACSAPVGYVGNDGDCDDTAFAVNPGRTEVCNSIDDDCDGDIDGDAIDMSTWYADADADTWGDASSTTEACAQPSGHVANSGDCDDAAAATYPGAPETCDDADNDCDGTIDENATDASTWYTDADADGYGTSSNAQVTCDQPAGTVAVSGDCNDAQASIHPGAAEVCDGVDQDCDGVADDGATDMSTWYADGDADGYGDAGSTTDACAAPSGYVGNDGDCDDAAFTVNPGRTEVCNSIDDDCDGDVDGGAVDAPTWYADSDGDAFGDASATLEACAQPSGYVGDATDCDDGAVAVFPGAPESCDDLDNDCDGAIDENAIDASTWYTDGDGDGHGTGIGSQLACDQPSGTVATSGDCNDAVASIHPGATEVCDGVDQDCDGVADDGATDMSTWYGDGDGDGYGDLSDAVDACSVPSGYVANSTDCDDAEFTVNPGRTEVCNSIDDDCDGDIDGDAIDAVTWYADTDGDAHGDASVELEACAQPAGYVTTSDDCDDAEAAAHPGAGEICDDIDNDCDGTVDEGASDATSWYADDDGDLYGDALDVTVSCDQPSGTVATTGDCNDALASVNPGESEVCDGVDNDCDGVADNGATDASTFYGDADGDGYGDLSDALDACSAPGGYVSNSTDCDDTVFVVNPGRTEVCNGVDDDCDGTVDVGAAGNGTWYEDADGDGFGDAGSTQQSCSQPSGYVLDASDCDDAEATTYPGAAETCDSVDNDCDSAIDEDATDASTWYADDDGDGYGDAGDAQAACSQPSGTVSTGTDCNDGQASIHPGATEVCDGVDQDCDGVADDNASDFLTFYEDGDGDGYGDSGSTTQACSVPSGYVVNSTDCDDAVFAVNPGRVEVCNSIDDDCDGDIDVDAVNASTWYADGDTDGYGDASSTTQACSVPSGYVGNSSDCDDAASATHPGAPETCDAADNDCDGAIDENATDATTWYGDSDADGYGELADAQAACSQPAGTVSSSNDCNDNVASIHPGATEVCDGVDQDCDGVADDNATDFLTFYEDDDGDGYGDALLSTEACNAPAGYVTDSTDCDDGAFAVNPGRAEVCNSIDDDCDGDVDVDAVDASTWYGDGDGDSYGDALDTTAACVQPAGFVGNSADCDDAAAATYPGAPETCDDADNDCDGAIDENATDASNWYGDNDGDGYGNLANLQAACDQPSGTVANSTDCNDAQASIHPGAAEVCDGVDQDCDGTADENATDASTFYEDGDGDGYGDALVSTDACFAPAGYVSDATDCNDAVFAVNPGRTEVCNSVDDDCDGNVDGGAVDATTWYLDGDGDDYGIAGSTTAACTEPAGYAAVTGDCDDAASTINPGAAEVCDSSDNDCDGIVDEPDATDADTWYADFDGDGFGTASNQRQACSQPFGFVDDSTDCNDAASDVYVGASETCDGRDQDCDGVADDNAIDAIDFFTDGDGDGFGAGVATQACSAPSGKVANDDDCNDANFTQNPARTELCNGIDDDCDGTTDVGAANMTTWYVDADSDGAGSLDATQQACSQPSGYELSADDCDDGEASMFPGNAEQCDGLDNDCSGLADYPVPASASTWYADIDDDGYGNSSLTTQACDQPTGYASVDGDCNDLAPTALPGGTETCDGLDNDCNGTVDDGAIGTGTWYEDGDGDGFGDAGSTLSQCSQPSGYVALSTDCDDAVAAINPNATEICNGSDDNCDGVIDDDAIDRSLFWPDADGDGYGLGASVLACEAPLGYGEDAGDCDDADADISPGATEACNGYDDDCDGATDESGGTVSWYLDADGDGYGADDTEVTACAAPSAAYVLDGEDCEDLDANIYPGAPLACDGTDADCDGDIDNDADDDGYADGWCGGDDCDDSDATMVPEVGGGCAVGGGCNDIVDGPNDYGDGDYLVDPDGFLGGDAAFTVECNMSYAGGGWTIIFTDDFSSPDAGWSLQTTSTCDGATILGGDGIWNASTTEDIEIDTLDIGHEEARVMVDIYAIDGWSNTDYWVSADTSTVVSDTWTNGLVTGGLCGSVAFGDDILFVDEIVEHSLNDMTLEFGIGASSINGGLAPSMGIDNVEVWIR